MPSAADRLAGALLPNRARSDRAAIWQQRGVRTPRACNNGIYRMTQRDRQSSAARAPRATTSNGRSAVVPRTGTDFQTMTIFRLMDTKRVILEVKTHECLWNPKNEQYKNQMAKYKAWAEVSQAVFPKFATCTEHEQIRIVRSVQSRWKTARDAYMKCTTKKSKYKSKNKKYIYQEQLAFLEQIKDIDKEKDGDEHDTPNTSVNTTDQSIFEALNNTADETCDEVMASDIDIHDDIKVKIEVDETEAAVLNIQTSNDDKEEKILPGTSTPIHNQEAAETVVDKPKATRKRLRNITPRKVKSEMTEFETRLLNVLRSKLNATPSTSALQADDQFFFNSLAPLLTNFNVHQKLLFRSKILEIVMEVGNIGPVTVKQDIETYVYEDTEEDNN
ncbi:hypothetical protein PYW07_010468 [Mythimna separata]|uniref:MADF domain-containing protein n=1 Tax=Mythimna separata TaxID=271217 RepID=A0AAD8DLQ5_MYTSE|nr:hypothetical protein PYW07_010468 [Mythimna separata]